MAQINIAFEVLSDPARRMEYDATIGIVTLRERESSQSADTKPTSVRLEIVRRISLGSPIYSLGFEPLSGRMVTASFDNEIKWWAKGMDGADMVHKFEGGIVDHMTVVAPNQILASGSSETLLYGWSLQDGKSHSWRRSEGHWSITTLGSFNGQWIASGSNDNKARIHSAKAGKVLQVCQGHEDPVTALAWASDSSFLVTGSSDATAKVWAPLTGKMVQDIRLIRGAVTALAISPDRNWLAVAAVDHSIRIFSLADGSLRKAFYGHENLVENLAFHPKTWILASGCRDGKIGIWNIKKGVGHGMIEASHYKISSLGFYPDGKYLAAGSLDKMLRIWRLSRSG